MNYTFEYLESQIDYDSHDHHRNLMKVLSFIDPNDSCDISNWNDTNFYEDFYVITAPTHTTNAVVAMISDLNTEFNTKRPVKPFP